MDPSRTAPYDDPMAWCDSLDAFEKEWQSIDRRRTTAGAAQSDREAYRSPKELAALALSGGGIRSATFNLGVLQTLGRHGLLKYFDYLSTVSGGGFIGGWWTAWLSREAPGPEAPTFPPDEGIETWRHHVRPRQRVAVPTPPTPDPVHHVRLFSNYLTPRKGVLSRDLWRAVTVISRNLLLTWAALVPFLIVAVALAQAMFLEIYGEVADGRLVLPDDGARLAAVANLPLIFLGWFCLLALVWLLAQRGNAATVQGTITIVAALAIGWLVVDALPVSGTRGLPVGFVVATVIMIAAAVSTIAPTVRNTRRDLVVNWSSRLQSLALVSCVVTLLVGLFAAYGAGLVGYLFTASRTGPEKLWTDIGKYVALATSLLSALHAARQGAPAGGGESRTTQPPSMPSRLLLRLAPFLTMLMLLLTIAWSVDWAVRTVDLQLWIALFRDITLVGALAMAGFAYAEPQRAVTPAWIVMTTASAVAIAAGSALWRDVAGAGGGLWPLPHGLALTVSLAGIVPLVVWCIRPRARAHSNPRMPVWRFDRAFWLLAAACVAVAVPTTIAAGFLDLATEVRFLIALCGALFTAVMLIGWTADPNMLSLHNFYKMRLVRAYLGASNPDRTRQAAEDVTETRPGDDILLKDVSDCVQGAPYHLINATLNLTAGSDLVVSQRAAAPFLFSRHFCGSAYTGFRHTQTYRSGTITLGSAVAISGAAASPVMGSQTPSTATSMLLAFLNVRFGYWLPTPNRMDWQAPQARLWPFYLLREFFSHVADTGSHCYITDGGHFDNTGVYSLIERGCRTILLTDCGADPDTVFDDLSNLIRRCRIDFGVEIRFNSLKPFSRATLAKHREPFVVGEILYPAAHLKGLGADTSNCTGTLLVIKPTVGERLDTDVNRYSQQYTDFPQQTTVDQWFDEAQFESYRRLGEVSAETAAGDIEAALLGRGRSAPPPVETVV